MSSFYREQLEKWLSRLEIEAEAVLDIGGGQKPVKGRTLAWKVKEYRVLDWDAQFKPDYFVDINYPVKLEKKFDIVFCLEVFEYIYDPVAAHKNLWYVLKPKGVAYISYPTFYPLHNPPKIDYLRYTKNAVEKLLGEVGFRSWEITPRIATYGAKALLDFYSLEQMRPIRGTPEILDIGYMCKAIK